METNSETTSLRANSVNKNVNYNIRVYNRSFSIRYTLTCICLHSCYFQSNL